MAENDFVMLDHSPTRCPGCDGPVQDCGYSSQPEFSDGEFQLIYRCPVCGYRWMEYYAMVGYAKLDTEEELKAKIREYQGMVKNIEKNT